MTEDEAKTKWCPFARPVFPHQDECGAQPGNRSFDGDGNTFLGPQYNCIASACMAWRLGSGRYEFAITRAQSHPEGFFTMPPPDGNGWERIERSAIDMQRIEWSRPVPRTEGYCGLAGKP